MQSRTTVIKSLSVQIALIALLIFGFNSTASAQEFFLLSDRLSLFCVYDPSNTGLAVSKKRGGVEYKDFDSQIRRVTKMAKSMDSRIKKLRRMKRDRRVNLREKISFRRIYKQIHQKKYRKDNAVTIRKFNQLINKATEVQAELFELLDEIELCRDRELNLATATGLSIEVLSFQFQHPQYKVPYYMTGVALVTTLSKRAARKGGGSLCVGNKTTLKEGIFPFTSNLCLTLFDFGAGGVIPLEYYSFCSPTAAGLSGRHAVYWVDWGIKPSEFSDADLVEYENDRDRLLERGYRGRPYLKRRGCRK